MVPEAMYHDGADRIALLEDLRRLSPRQRAVLVLRYFVPRMQKLSTEAAEARSMLTGRIVDSYTNIATVKLFAHTEREDDYARQALSQHLQLQEAEQQEQEQCNKSNAEACERLQALAAALRQLGALAPGALGVAEAALAASEAACAGEADPKRSRSKAAVAARRASVDSAWAALVQELSDQLRR
jgi:ABC-type multidrug transport system fused ATPase/permease subunit